MANSGINIDFSDFTRAALDMGISIKKLEEGIDTALNTAALEIEATAKRLAPKDMGAISQGISANTNGRFQKEITVNTPYAAYAEFGTGKYAAAYASTLPADWKTYAAQFKGKTGGGNFDQFLERIYQWAKRKQIGVTYDIKTRRKTKVGKQSAETTMRATAYFIAIRILQNGIRPHPFLFPAAQQQRPKLQADIEATIQALKI